MTLPLNVLIVDDEPLAVERMQVVCAKLDGVQIAGTASDGEAALRMVEALQPDVVLLDITMPRVDGMTVASRLSQKDSPPAIVFVTAHDGFAVEAFDLEAVDYVLKPVSPDRLERAISRVAARRQPGGQQPTSPWLSEIWVPHHSELLRIAAQDIERIDADRDYVKLHVGTARYLLLQTIAGLEEKLDPEKFIRIHRSHILRRDTIAGLKHEGMGVWCVETKGGEELRVGRTYLPDVKKMAGR